MSDKPRKMSDNMKEMAERLLRNPHGDISSEAMHVALMLANIAWNETVGLDVDRKTYRLMWESIASENPNTWNEFKTINTDAMIDELVEYKKKHYANDMRRILTCGMPAGNVRVEWLHAAAPGVNSNLEMHIYALLRMGEFKEAKKVVQKEFKVKGKEADRIVARHAEILGII